MEPKRHLWGRWIRRLGLVLLLACPLIAAATDGTDASATINRVKAAYLYNFTKFVSWPDQAFGAAQDPVVVGVLDGAGGATVALITHELAGKSTPDGRPIEVRAYGSAAEATAAHILFVTRAAGVDAPAARSALADRPVLLVGESPGFAGRGGVINFTVSGDLVRCEINLRSAERATLKLSSRLASVARLVRDEADAP